MDFLIVNLVVWGLCLFTGCAATLLFVIWAMTTQVKPAWVRGVLPGIVGLTLMDGGIFLMTYFAWNPAALDAIALIAAVVGVLSFVYFARFLTFLGATPFLNVVRRWVLVLGWGLVAVTIGIFLLPVPEILRRVVIIVDFTSNLGTALVAVLIAMGLKSAAGDSPDVKELKQFFRRMAWPFLILLPVTVLDVLWPSPHPLGHRFTSFALQGFAFYLLYLWFFFRWVGWHVKHFSLGAAPGTINAGQLAVFGISNREREVIELLNEGRSNKDIAGHLFIGSNTVKNHIANIYRKTEVKSRVELLNLFR